MYFPSLHRLLCVFVFIIKKNKHQKNNFFLISPGNTDQQVFWDT